MRTLSSGKDYLLQVTTLAKRYHIGHMRNISSDKDYLPQVTTLAKQ